MDIFEIYKSELELVEKELETHLCSNQPDLNDICKYISKLHGKRFRPLVVILSYKIVGGKDLKEIIPIATAIEFIHTATLVHDDVNDRSSLRRGNETVYSKYGMSKALIMGDFLFALGFKLGGSYGGDIVNLVAELSSNLAEGEFIHMNNTRNPLLTEKVYFKIIKDKTAGPIEGGAKIGGIIGKGSAAQIDKLGRFGQNIGMAFQIVDDIFDVTGIESNLGKPVGVDLRNGKITLLTIQAIKELDESRRRRLIDIIEDSGNVAEMFDEAAELIRSTNAISYAKEKAEEFVNLAIENLEDFKDNDIYPSLVALAKYAIERKA